MFVLKDFGAIMALHKDLESLQKGEVECKRRKAANIQSKREAFNNYLGLIYRQRHDIRVCLSTVSTFSVFSDNIFQRNEFV